MKKPKLSRKRCSPLPDIYTPIEKTSKPYTNIEREKAPDIIVVVQPKSISIGLRKTPKLKYMPKTIIIVTKETVTIK